MVDFYIKRIIVSGGKNEPSILDFDKGLNIVCGPSNTGKSYIIECLDYLFGSKTIRLDQKSGHDTVKAIVQSNAGGTVTFERKLDTKTIRVSSTVNGIDSDDYKVDGSKNNISDVWLSLIGIEGTPSIIKNGRFDKQRLTFRSFLHALLIDETHVFQTESIMVSRHDTQKTASLSALLYLLTGLNYEETDPKEEKKIKEAKKKAVVAYINARLGRMAERVSELDKIPIDDTQSMEAKVNAILDEISTTEQQITNAIGRSQQLMKEIYCLNEQLAECNVLYNRYQALRSQYNADIKRLTFIVEGEMHKSGFTANAKCPFCDGDINEQHEHSYAEASHSEAERIALQLKDLAEAEKDIVSEREALIVQINKLSDERSGVEVIINGELKPKVAGLKQSLREYRRAIEIRNEVAVIHQMETTMKSELFDVQAEEESTQTQFDVKSHFDGEMRVIIDKILTRLLQTCKYDGFSSVYFNQKDFDVVVNGNRKASFGKGYRAFLNTILAIAFMEYFALHGKYPPKLLIVDSPILSLKEKVNDEASDSMKAALFQYLIDNQQHGQIIIVENDIPRLDYKDAKVIRFTKDIHNGRYGFLNGVV
ncbi:MAG: AAA family ATPase [Eubacteriales bacterium]|nr:AAA family ATPase [Eubacteriales bacterium]